MYVYMLTSQIPLKMPHHRNPPNPETQIPRYKMKENEPKVQFEFVPRSTERSEFFDLVGFGGAAFSVESVYVVICGIVCSMWVWNVVCGCVM